MLARKLLFSIVFVVTLAMVIGIFWFLQPRNRLISDKTFEGVVFHTRNAAQVLNVMFTNARTADAYWMPTNEDIRKMEQQLKLGVQTQAPTIAARLPEYKRQYFGFIREGKRMIFIVGFCDPGEVNWRVDLVSTPDALRCYFEAQYDVENVRLLYVWELSGG